MLMVFAFIALAVPLLSAALGLASTMSIDSGVKNRITKSQYAVIGGNQHAIYRLFYEAGYAESLTEGVEDSYSVTVAGEQITVSVTKLSNPNSNPPPPNADNSRRLQTLKSVEPTTAAPSTPTTFTYTITVENRDDKQVNLNKIHDRLPTGFSYVGGSTTDDPTIVMETADGNSYEKLTWDLGSLNIKLQPQESETLLFDAQATVAEGTYCNEAWADPGGEKTGTGKAAQITVGSPPSGLCAGDAVRTSKSVYPDSAPGNTQTAYTYTISIENIGTGDLNLERIRDLLPEGFLYVTGTTTGDITNADPNATMHQGRHRLDWDFAPTKQLPAGQTWLHVFDADATAAPGEFWNEVWLTFDEFSYTIYTWPTAVINVMAVFETSATDGERTVSSEVWVGADSYFISQWDAAP